MLDCPGRRRSNSSCISSREIGSFGGQPSTTTPTAAPCDSPHVVMRKSAPKLLDMWRRLYLRKERYGPLHSQVHGSCRARGGASKGGTKQNMPDSQEIID